MEMTNWNEDMYNSLKSILEPYQPLGFEFEQDQFTVDLPQSSCLFRIKLDCKKWDLFLIPKGGLLDDSLPHALYDEIEELLCSWNKYSINTEIERKVAHLWNKCEYFKENMPTLINRMERKHPFKIRLTLNDPNLIYVEAGYSGEMKQWYLYPHRLNESLRLPYKSSFLIGELEKTVIEWNINFIRAFH